MKYFYFLFSTLFSFILFVNITFAITPEGIDLKKSSTGYQLEFSLPDYQLNSVYAEGEEYFKLTIPDYGVTSEVGLPALPLISFNIFVAYKEESAGLVIKNVQTEELTIAKKIYPFQMPWEKHYPLGERPFTINKDYYNSTGNLNQPLVEISEPFIIAGVKGVMITIYPFRYSPSENRLIITQKASIDINLEYPVQPVMDKSQAFTEFFNNVFANYEGVASRSNMKYLVITAPTFETDMQPFVSHKVSKGFDVDMFNTTATGTTKEAIKSFIQQRYNDPSTKPDFVLLVGDVAQIPAWTGTGAGSPTTDLNYAQLEGGDYFADVFIGRFSVTTSTQLQNAINKSVYMEDYIGTLAKKNIFMASSDNYQITEGTHNFVIDNYFGPAGYTNLKLYSHSGATTQQLINALNDDQIFAIYSGHGSETSWADGPPLNQSQVNTLTNTWYPYVYSFACLTGSFATGECFGETWLRTAHGASTFYGSSVTSYWDEDDILERKIFYSMFEDEITRVTPMFDMGKIYLVNYYGGGIGPGTTTLRYCEMYNLMGDPSMPVVETVPPCSVEDPSNPNPEDNAVGIPISLTQLTWTNGAGAVTNETYFGTNQSNLNLVQNGTLASSWNVNTTLEYGTEYYWRIVEIGDTCSTLGPIWSFTTVQDPNLVTDTITVYPQNAQYWTGTSTAATKIDGEINTVSPNAGWAMFDLSGMPTSTTAILSIQFYGYVNATYYPYWSATPMGVVNPILDPASSIVTQINNSYSQGTAYIYSNESSSFTTGWHDYPLEASATTDFMNCVSQGWFAMGFIDRDGVATYYINFDGWNQPNRPYLVITYQYIVPVELTSFTASVNKTDVTLNWKTVTETNNQGFDIERMGEGGQFEKIGYVAGFGTTTEPKNYSFNDTKLEPGNYTYRLKQVDLDGTYKYSDEVNIEVSQPLEYSLEQNYPNPFNPSTIIKYSIPEDGVVKLAVYNLLGEEVTNLVNTQQKAGRYEVVFDASGFASGVYIYRLESNSYSSIKKMLLIK